MHIVQMKMYGMHQPDIPPPETCTINCILEGVKGDKWLQVEGLNHKV